MSGSIGRRHSQVLDIKNNHLFISSIQSIQFTESPNSLALFAKMHHALMAIGAIHSDKFSGHYPDNFIIAEKATNYLLYLESAEFKSVYIASLVDADADKQSKKQSSV